MGRVFSLEDIEQRRVPMIGSFQLLVRIIREHLEAEDGVVGAILCGSAVYGNYTPRSDIDCVIVYRRTEYPQVLAVMRELYRQARPLCIPLELIPLDSDVVRTPMHHIEASFADHLRYVAEHGGLIKRNPLDLFNFGSRIEREDIRNYIRNKIRRLEKGWAEFPVMAVDEQMLLLQKTLEAPVHVARKLLWHKRVKMPDDSKSMVERFFMELATPDEGALFDRLLTADRAYTEALYSQLITPDQSQYLATLDGVAALTIDTLEFVRLVARRLH